MIIIKSRDPISLAKKRVGKVTDNCSDKDEYFFANLDLLVLHMASITFVMISRYMIASTLDSQKNVICVRKRILKAE